MTILLFLCACLCGTAFVWGFMTAPRWASMLIIGYVGSKFVSQLAKDHKADKETK